MSDIDDASEFAEAADSFYEQEAQNMNKTKRDDQPEAIQLSGKTESSDKPTPGQITQYALYGRGYTATTPTVQSLPAGCYDIIQDSRCTYVQPAGEPSGLLMELPEMRSDEVIKIVENFWDSEKDYKEGNKFVIGGAIYKAGVIIYGPPGTGKSCTIKIVSKKLVERGGTVFYAGTHPLTVLTFLQDFSKIEKNRKCIVILEDIDTLIHNYGESYYLEMLDSAKSIDNVMFIATTNYPDRLDPRVYNRPGRFSSVVKIGFPGKKAREAYLKAILKDYQDVEYIVDQSSGFSIDHLTALVNAVYREKKDLAKEIHRLRTLFKIPKADEDKSMGIGSTSFEERDDE